MVPGTGIEPVRCLSASGGFSSHCGFHRQPEAVCALDYAFTLACRCRCPPCSLYTFPHAGLARRCLEHTFRGFSEFDGIHTGAFATWCSMDSSPLCLPLSPPRQGEASDCSRLRRHVSAAPDGEQPCKMKPLPLRESRYMKCFDGSCCVIGQTLRVAGRAAWARPLHIPSAFHLPLHGAAAH